GGSGEIPSILIRENAMLSSLSACWPRAGAVLVLLAASGRCPAYEGVTQVGKAGEQIVGYVQDAQRIAGFRGAVLAAKEGKVIAAVAVGAVGDGAEQSLK